MIQGMVGRKLGMTQVFDDSGVVHPVTVIECGPNVVTQIRTRRRTATRPSSSDSGSTSA